MTELFRDRLQDIKDKWFLTEPAYFMILCTHDIVVNAGMKCPIAVGGGMIYINEKAYEDKTDKYLEESLKIELVRILLKHPYQRQLPNRVKMYLASNFVLANNMTLSEMKLTTTLKYFNSHDYDRECLEGIYDAIKFPESKDNQDGNQGSGQGQNGQTPKGKSNNGKGNSKKDNTDSNSAGNSKKGNGQGDPLKDFDDGCSSTEDAFERTQFWKEDDYRNVEINNIIGKIDAGDSWGTIPGNVVDTIKKSITPKFNYKALFQQFRSTIVSSDYSKTRMKPSRRFGYAAMGSKRKNTTKLLVAVDTSGSISDEDLELALGWIRGFFDYAVEELKVIQFDYNIYKDSLVDLKKRPTNWRIHGRGGTDFNDIFEYVQSDKNCDYNGVLILTDGYASAPKDKWLKTNYKNVKYMWVLNSEYTWERFKDNKEFLKFGKCTYLDTKK